MPTRGGRAVSEVMWGTGSSTTTLCVVVVQPEALQALRVTCLVPFAEKVMVGFCAVEVPCAWAPAASGRSARDTTRALRKAGEGLEYNRIIDSSPVHPHYGVGRVDKTLACFGAAAGANLHPPPGEPPQPTYCEFIRTEVS